MAEGMTYSEAEVMRRVHESLSRGGFTQALIDNVVNTLHANDVVFRLAPYLNSPAKNELAEVGRCESVIYLSIGNSDNNLTQGEWADFIKDIDQQVASIATTVHGRWFSAPDDPWQNACWALEFRSDARLLTAAKVTAEVRARYRQESAAWAVASTIFI